MTTENISPKTNPRHETFIHQMILHGDKLRAYKAAYPKATDEAARTASTRLMKNPGVKEKLSDAHKEIHIGLAKDKIAFIHQELKIISLKRKLLLEIITGRSKATVNEKMRAIRMDNELAEQQAMLLDYGSLKPGKLIPQKNAETGTKMNNEQAPSPSAETIEPAMDNNWDGVTYSGDLHVPVTPVTDRATGYTPYSCNPLPDMMLPDIDTLLAILENNRNNKWTE